jgi:hypothetical protein
VDEGDLDLGHGTASCVWLASSGVWLGGPLDRIGRSRWTSRQFPLALFQVVDAPVPR